MHNDHCWGLNVWYLTNGIITGCFTSNDKLYIIYLQIHDPQLAEAVLTSVYRHMWYLTEELVVLALADSDTSDDEKSHMVAQMAAVGRPQQFLPRKPAMKPDILRGRQPDGPELHEFIGERSWLLFHLLNVDVTWMAHPPHQWNQYDGFRRFCTYVENMNVVNDAAERAVKDVTEFANYCQDPDRRDDVIKVVNSHRELIDFAHLTKDEIANI